MCLFIQLFMQFCDISHLQSHYWKDICQINQSWTCFLTQDPDNTLKRKTFELLYKMMKSSNLEVIVDCLIDYMTNINDHYKAEIASRCVELAEQFAPSNHCFIQTVNRVFKHAVDLVNIKVATT